MTAVPSTGVLRQARAEGVCVGGSSASCSRALWTAASLRPVVNVPPRPCSFLWLLPLCQGMVSGLAGQGRGAVSRMGGGGARGLRGAGFGSGSHQRQLLGDELAGAGGAGTWLSFHLQRGKSRGLGPEERACSARPREASRRRWTWASRLGAVPEGACEASGWPCSVCGRVLVTRAC